MYLNTCKYTIGDMQNEMDFYGHNNEFEYNNDFVILLKYKYIYISMYTKYNYTYLCESTINFSKTLTNTGEHKLKVLQLNKNISINQ